MDIENKLKAIFDYQKFENNTRVDNIIEASSKKGMLLSDEDLSMVNAAGNLYGTKAQNSSELTAKEAAAVISNPHQ